jgi:hypothetical protein
MILKDWYGPGKDLALSSDLPSFWNKSLKSSGFDPSIVQLCKEQNLVPPPERESKLDPNLSRLLEREEGIDL